MAKCLTISLEEKNRQEIEKQLKSTTTDCSRYLLDNPQYKVAGIVNNIILRSNKNVQFWI